MNAADIRRAFCEFFTARHDHTPVPSSSLIPAQDPTLLFTNAGMVQFKQTFLGEDPRPYVRAVSVQKCVRAGGKHNDLEHVGYTGRHHTFFEMLGNFSFGDYFKDGAIRMAWGFVTDVLKLPPDRLWVTVFREDDEAARLWREAVGVRPERIVRLGEKDNFWQMGDTGPCGPCSEIYVDQGAHVGCGKPTCGVGCDCDRYLEIWNLVFMQYNRDASGTLSPLPRPSIDTGMGLERVAAVTQGVFSNYDSDLFRPVLDAIGRACGTTYGRDVSSDVSMRVIADHLRALTFLLSDGVLPSNEGRGYVVRRVLRRAARHGKLLGLDGPFLHDLSATVAAQMQDAYPELARNRQAVARTLLAEEERFAQTLSHGMTILSGLVDEAKRSKTPRLTGTDLFKLYDTYGFPMDLIADVAKEHGLSLDEAGFAAAMDEQRERARAAGGFEAEQVQTIYKETAARTGPTEFLSEDGLDADVRVLAILKDGARVREAREGEQVELVFDHTPCYGEGGGQLGDRGELVGPNADAEIRDTVIPVKGLYVHAVAIRRGRVVEGDRYRVSVNRASRQACSNHHTGTHLLHAILRETLGDHVKQAGSLVAPDRLRFDFHHFAPLSPRELERVEQEVNRRIQEDHHVEKTVMSQRDALASGALAFFGEKYGDQVRVVSIGSFSKELCGGTHTRDTGELGLLKIVREAGVAAGVRRIEAVAGEPAYLASKKDAQDLAEIAGLFKAPPHEAVSKARKLVESLRAREREIEQLKTRLAGGGRSESSSDRGRTVAGVTVASRRIDGMDAKDLRAAADRVREQIKSGVVVLGAVAGDKVNIVAAVTPDLAGRFHAGNLVRAVADLVGGTGGGNATMGQAGGRNPERLDEALERVYGLVEAMAGAR
ncbi:MAG: alanine--tRNA ligase [Nitrospirota bacterium]